MAEFEGILASFSVPYRARWNINSWMFVVCRGKYEFHLNSKDEILRKINPARYRTETDAQE